MIHWIISGENGRGPTAMRGDTERGSWRKLRERVSQRNFITERLISRGRLRLGVLWRDLVREGQAEGM